MINMKKNKFLVFDMDGTIADLYGIDNWLESLKAEDPTPYIKAQPFYKPEVLNTVLKDLKKQNWTIIVTTWLSKGSSKEYDRLVREAKLAWLDKHNFPYDEVHLVKYGTTKANCTRKHKGFQILIDDNEKVRKGWNLGATIDANMDIIDELEKLIK